MSETSPENEVMFSVIDPDAGLSVASIARSTVTLPGFLDVMTTLRGYTGNTNHTGELEESG